MSSDQFPVTSYWWSVNIGQFPVPSHQFPVTSSQSPVPSHQFPVTSSQSPVPSHQFPVTSSQSPVPNPPISSLQSPISNHQSPITSLQSTNHQSPITNLGREDEEGYFWLTGRKKELIIRGGHNIDPKQIEEPMHRHPAVALAAAVGRPDPRVGELPVVYIELKPDSSATTEELMAFARENIGERAAIPKKLYILDQLPLTAVGKIYKPTLSDEQVADVYQAELKQINGIANTNITVEGDKRLGKIAHIQITAVPGTDKAQLEQIIRTALGNYVVHYDLKIA